ncbi:MAG: DUF3881 family protein [Lachnospiraceae bacterium]|nr:DUF3881 family protein [Lachnospiraceae bacterium]
MHKYLRSIGFKDITKERLSEIFYRASKDPTAYEMAMDSEGNEFSEIRYEVAPHAGIAIRGNYDENDNFTGEYYFPYYEAVLQSSTSTVHIIRQSDRECYQGVCEDNNVAFDIIFHLQNMLPYLQAFESTTTVAPANVSLCGLSLEAKIIMPVYTDETIKAKRYKAKVARDNWMAKAREGDAGAYEKLTMDDMDKYSMISRRIQNEDVLSIVSSTFMPSGIENDKYAVIGDIVNYKTIINYITKQNVYVLTIDCNDLKIDVCINEEDLFGAPAIGRRFKGVVWMQGRLDI